MLKQPHKDMKANVTASGTFSDKISIENGVKQGNILTFTLFSIYFAVLLMFAFNDCDTDIYLRFRTSLKVFNLRRFDAKTKSFEMLIHELLYADDAPFIAQCRRYAAYNGSFLLCLHCIRAHNKSEKDESDVHTCTRRTI